MINKVLESGYNGASHFPEAAVIPEFKGALDRDTLKKRASIFDAEYDKFERIFDGSREVVIVHPFDIRRCG